MEAAGLGGFIIGASLLTVLLEHPDLFVMESSLGAHPLLRRVPLGLLMGAYIALVVYVCGERSDAHINPAVTLSFLRLGKIKRWDAAFYILAQFAGAILAALLMTIILGKLYEHPSIPYVTTTSDNSLHNVWKAFVAEFIISFVLMFVVLFVIHSKRWEKSAALVTGVLLGLYLVFETPYSGMSLNPARSTGSAIAAGDWRDLWVYFTAPVLAMLVATEIFLRLKRSWIHDASWSKESPMYPVEQTST